MVRGWCIFEWQNNIFSVTHTALRRRRIAWKNKCDRHKWHSRVRQSLSLSRFPPLLRSLTVIISNTHQPADCMRTTMKPIYILNGRRADGCERGTNVFSARLKWVSARGWYCPIQYYCVAFIKPINEFLCLERERRAAILQVLSVELCIGQKFTFIMK